jgi:uncharacterized SAM-binding protein YcdF (DUF218 family)
VNRIVRRLYLLLLLLLALLALFALVAAVDVYQFSQRDEARPADAAIVLGAAAWGNRPSPVLRERVNQAIRLYRQGLVGAIILTGGQGNPDEPAEAEVARRYALAQGVPESALLLESHSTNTFENLSNARAVAAQNGLDSFLVVSTPYHMRRAMALADDLALEAYPAPTRTIRWLTPYTNGRAFAREVAAYMAYLVFGA